MKYNEAIEQFTIAMSWLQAQAIRLRFDSNYQFDGWDNAKHDAAVAGKWLIDNGHEHLIFPMMEMLEYSTWYFSPEEESQEHCKFLESLYREVVDYAYATLVDDADDNTDQDKDASDNLIPDEIYGDVDPDQVELLKACFAKS